MKKNFDTSALRKTAADIQGAVVPKSITPDMVGGLFSALVEAQGEVIEALGTLEREVVTVKVNGYDGDGRVSAAGAKVYVDIFSIGSVPTVALPRQELTANEEGVVTFEVFKGYRYSVFSKIAGLGASFQLAYLAGQEARTIELWNLPMGVYMYGLAAYYIEAEDTYRCVPIITENYEEELYEAVNMDWDVRDGEVSEDCYYLGVLVSSGKTSFYIEEKSKAEDTLRWAASRQYATAVPTMPLIPIEPSEFDGDREAAYNNAVELARRDFDGNLNTAKILAFDGDAPAAKFCESIEVYDFRQAFLPSAGQLYLMYLNKEAIESLISDANDAGREFNALGDGWYWSSTQEDEFCAWGVNMDSGGANYHDKYLNYYVRAVSAFQYKY